MGLRCILEGPTAEYRERRIYSTLDQIPQT